jgi:hypothetical protein
VQIDAIAIRLRRRSDMEAADLGVRLCQSAARDIYACYLAVAVPLFAFAIATYEIANWLPVALIWWWKPWLDRTILYVLSRAAFGQRTSLADLWQAKRDVLWRQLFLSLTQRRLSPWRSFTQPVYQLEGVPFSQRGRRIRQIRLGKSGNALAITAAYSLTTLILTLALLSLAFWLAPTGSSGKLDLLFTDEDQQLVALVYPAAYAIAVLAIEPFFVAAGFAMYLNRRVELEAWDIEQELRRAFGQ